jgi:hypothetical protein
MPTKTQTVTGEGDAPRVETARLSKNVARSLRHKLNMVWMRDHSGDGWYDGKSDERDHEVAYVYNAIANTYASKNYAGALWLDRELKLKQSYEIAVERTPLGQAMPSRPLLYTLFDEAACYATNPLSSTSTKP